MSFDFTDFLQERKKQHLYRTRRTIDGPQGAEVETGGKKVLLFCSNDYLGLANHPKVVEAFRKGAGEYGVGSGASHLVCGHMRPHQALEEELAEWTGRPRALLFSSGYMANLGVISTLIGREDALFEDRLNHASLIDAGQLCRGEMRRYPHASPEALDSLLEKSGGKRKLVVTDGVFSMDGDLAPLPDLAAAAERRGAWLMVDDAHGLGVAGKTGRGTLEHFGLGIEQVPILMGTLGKALGTYGAFVAGPEDLIETLIQSARTYIYTTALPPAVAEATRAALAIVREEPDRRHRLQHLIGKFRDGAGSLGLPVLPSESAIQPLVIGDTEKTLQAGETLMEAGIRITPIRPPTVPEGTARLRITLSAAHTDGQVDRLLDALDKIVKPLLQQT